MNSITQRINSSPQVIVRVRFRSGQSQVLGAIDRVSQEQKFMLVWRLSFHRPLRPVASPQLNDRCRAGCRRLVRTPPEWPFSLAAKDGPRPSGVTQESQATGCLAAHCGRWHPRGTSCVWEAQVMPLALLKIWLALIQDNAQSRIHGLYKRLLFRYASRHQKALTPQLLFVFQQSTFWVLSRQKMLGYGHCS